jgi:hypothetical protein
VRVRTCVFNARDCDSGAINIDAATQASRSVPHLGCGVVPVGATISKNTGLRDQRARGDPPSNTE